LESLVGFQTPYQPHKLIVPVLHSRDVPAADVRDLVSDLYGELDSASESFDFTFTDYYMEEMGQVIDRVLFSVRDLVDPPDLAGFKVASNAAETRTSRPDGTRTINLDPGLLSLSRVILATTKASAHRIPIGRSIHAEVTLLYRHGRFHGLEWTYPDFAGGVYHPWLLSVRRRYHEQLRALDPERPWRL
jgi:hypothetical protein